MRRERQLKTEALRPLFLVFYVTFPGVRATANGDDQIAGARCFRLPREFHACFMRQPVALAMIAGVTSAGGVGPLIASPA